MTRERNSTSATTTPAAKSVDPGPVSSRIRVAEAMHHGVLSCPTEASLAEIAWLMATHRIHCVVVSDEPEKADALWGIVSDLDLVAAGALRDLDEQTAGATAATPAVTVAAGETLQRAAQLMTEHCVTHLVVVDAAGRPLGILSTLDVAAALGDR